MDLRSRGPSVAVASAVAPARKTISASPRPNAVGGAHGEPFVRSFGQVSSPAIGWVAANPSASPVVRSSALLALHPRGSRTVGPDSSG
ncbi:hypothetical protein [Streptomyces sp. NPDC056669]|uniref:hypothetical protein n=1 Tax=unclassified Streptomyces TaxID=2593676 RepID=UPI003692D82C